MPEKPQPFEELDELIERMNRQFDELSRTFDTGVDPVLADISVDVADTGDEARRYCRPAGLSRGRH
ncbi:MAG: hypothetical protein J07HN4v3_02695 [Halonotius sp. J07HN4]|nr:MAG: hypothetical protein J07HN4v3_02695 [Halonotius sp. J07HN4]